ncbi:MAG: site-specific integrase [Alistipes sp.]
MANVSLYYDTRYKGASGKNQLYYRAVLPGRRNLTIRTGFVIPPEWWDGSEIIRAPQKDQMNRSLHSGVVRVEEALLSVQMAQGLDGKTSDIRARVVALMDGVEYVGANGNKNTFSAFFERFTEQKSHKATRSIYQATKRQMDWFAEKVGHSCIWAFDEITTDWLFQFEHFLLTKHLDDKGGQLAHVRPVVTNTVAISLRNIRAVVNAAIDDEKMTKYPFRKFKIKQEETAKRSLTADQLRTLMSYPCEEYQVKYRDLFVLIFYLIGINTIDLFSLKEVANGRIEYRRSKTGRLFSVKVEPEAQAIINKYKGNKYLLDVLDIYGNYKDFAHRMNGALGDIGEVERKGLGGKKIRTPLFPNLTTYWARHTWATIAAELDVPDATISAALGHSSGNQVTNIYIRRDPKKVDAANRKVIDYILGKTAPVE